MRQVSKTRFNQSLIQVDKAADDNILLTGNSEVKSHNADINNSVSERVSRDVSESAGVRHLTALENDVMPVIEEEDKDEMDELMSQRDLR